MDAAPLSPWKRHLMLTAGLWLLLSSAAHSFLGWPSIRPQLVAAGVADDMVGALAVGWHFGGVAMAAFAVIVILAWYRARAAAGGLAPAAVVGIAYVVFGTAAFVLRSFEPFFLIFIIPGMALVIGSWPWTRSR